MREDAAQPAADADIDAHATEKRDADKHPVGNPGLADGEQPADAEKPADANTPSDTPSRAARRREQRAERKTLKRIPLFPNRRRTREDVAEMLAFKAELESRRPVAFEFQRRQSEKRKAAAAQNIADAKKPDAGEQLAAAAKNIAAEKPDADAEQRDDAKQPATDAKKRNADAEKPDVAAEQRDDAKQSADADKNPANANTPSDTLDRAARRRQKRAARQSPKGAPPVSNPTLPRISPPSKKKPKAATEQPAATDRTIATDNTPSANPGNPGRAARRREQRARPQSQKAQSRQQQQQWQRQDARR